MANEYIRKQDVLNLPQSIERNLRGEIVERSIDVNDIEALEPADVAPVVHAHWIRHDDADVVEGYYVPEYECSKCRAWKKDDSDFCPDCGAKMDKGQKHG